MRSYLPFQPRTPARDAATGRSLTYIKVGGAVVV
jgi:hypothetical protein